MSELMTDPNMPIPMARVAPDYVIVEESIRVSLEAIVVKLMANGWKPTGGVHVRTTPAHVVIYTQALTKGI